MEKFQIGQTTVAIFMGFAMQPKIFASHRVQTADIGITIQPLAELGYMITLDFLRLAGGDINIDYRMGLVVIFCIAAAQFRPNFGAKRIVASLAPAETATAGIPFKKPSIAPETVPE